MSDQTMDPVINTSMENDGITQGMTPEFLAARNKATKVGNGGYAVQIRSAGPAIGGSGTDPNAPGGTSPGVALEGEWGQGSPYPGGHAPGGFASKKGPKG